jgi:hypothetical protein
MDPEKEEAETVSGISFLLLQSRAVIANDGDEPGN